MYKAEDNETVRLIIERAETSMYPRASRDVVSKWLHRVAAVAYQQGREDALMASPGTSYRQKETMRDWRLNTDDRVAQVEWLTELAAIIADNRGTIPPRRAVDCALAGGDREGVIPIPEWFTDDDYEMMVLMVETATNKPA